MIISSFDWKFTVFIYCKFFTAKTVPLPETYYLYWSSPDTLSFQLSHFLFFLPLDRNHHLPNKPSFLLLLLHSSFLLFIITFLFTRIVLTSTFSSPSSLCLRSSISHSLNLLLSACSYYFTFSSSLLLFVLFHLWTGQPSHHARYLSIALV